MGSHRLECHTDLQYRRVPDDDRCPVGFFLAGGDVHILARTGKESAFLVALAADWIADRVWISLQIHERVRARFDLGRPRIGSPAKTGICAARFIFPARYVRSLHRPADYLERAACLDQADASAITRGNRAGVWLPSGRDSFISRPAFSCLFAISVSRAGVGRYWKLAPRESAIQGAVPNVVRIAGVPILPPLVDQQKCCAKLGRARLSRFRPARGLFLVGTPRSERYVTPLRKRGVAGRISHERDRVGYRLVAHRRLPIAAK